MRSGPLDVSKQVNAWFFIFLLAGQEVAHVHAARREGQALLDLEETHAVAQFPTKDSHCVRKLSGCEPAEFCEKKASTAGLMCKRKMEWRSDLEVSERFVETSSQILALSLDMEEMGGVPKLVQKFQQAVYDQRRCITASLSPSAPEKPLLRSLVTAFDEQTAASFQETLLAAAKENSFRKKMTDFNASKHSAEVPALESAIRKMTKSLSPHILPAEYASVDLPGMLHEVLAHPKENISHSELLAKHCQLNESETARIVSEVDIVKREIEDSCVVNGSEDDCKMQRYRDILKSLEEADDAEELEESQELVAADSLLQTRSALSLWQRVQMSFLVFLSFTLFGTLVGYLAMITWPAVVVFVVILAVFGALGLGAGVANFSAMHPRYLKKWREKQQQRRARERAQEAPAQLPASYPPARPAGLGLLPEGYPPASEASRPASLLPEGYY
eukprot:CAMPEP_0197658824 /NCGR_PEP_ID=MMETSP1338-20131121/45467_1 /TAXON_ID=43686 ORGANISM="Pelagodinium beii, Strain RCC1491" /NCGR_SAMPLE_ID=MMETSP1338 /ASSEMBLY_ACC=CAM_ASM_000754 /LENGTH=445 /DNA_ID=CAMNT_0043235483 /DNA_START=50 /DNA_END=1387 /DNA_ORIENTATION=-